MPIVTIQIVKSKNDNPYTAADVQKISDRLGKIFNSDSGGTWVKLEYLDRNHYAENEVPLNSIVQPTLVEVLKRSLPNQDSLAVEAQQIAINVAHVFSRPVENVHIIYLPPGEGRVAFGGNLLPKREGNNE